MELNNKNKFGHVNRSIIDFGHDISGNGNFFDAAEGSRRKGKWSPREDDMLIKFVEENGTKKENGKVEVKWGVIARELNRTYKSCRLRWYNQLAPGISFERFSPEEDDLIIRMVREFGPMWSKIAEMLKCRTDNQVKNRWNSALKNVQGQKLPVKVSSSRVTQNLKQGAKSTHENMNDSRSSPSSNSTLQLFSNSTIAGPMAELPPPASLPFLRPYLPDGSLYCPHSHAFDTPDPSAAYASPDPVPTSTFDWFYSPSLHPPGCEIPDGMYPAVYPEPSAFNPTQERQCTPAGGIPEPMGPGDIKLEPEPQKPPCNPPGFDWLNLL